MAETEGMAWETAFRYLEAQGVDIGEIRKQINDAWGRDQRTFRVGPFAGRFGLGDGKIHLSPPCPDKGACHHSCPLAGPCFRVLYAGPLSGVFPGNEWPAEVRAAAGLPPRPEPSAAAGVEVPGVTGVVLPKPATAGHEPGLDKLYAACRAIEDQEGGWNGGDVVDIVTGLLAAHGYDMTPINWCERCGETPAMSGDDLCESCEDDVADESIEADWVDATEG
jgi:hypothetical protein